MLRKRIKSVVLSILLMGITLSSGVIVEAHNSSLLDKDENGVCSSYIPIMYINGVANANEVTIPVGRMDLLRKAIQFYDTNDGLLNGEEFHHAGDLAKEISRPGTVITAVGAGNSNSGGLNTSMFLKINVVSGNVNIPEPRKVVSDWKKHWANYEIRYSMCKYGFSPTLDFRPDEDITRAEVVKVVTSMTESWNNGDPNLEKFVDVGPNDWFFYYVNCGLYNDIITQSTYFRPYDKITREEFAVIISNYKTDKKGDTNHDKFSEYSDYSQASDWAKNSIEYVIEQGYMGEGGGKFNPKANITRAEVATVMARLLMSEK